METASTVWRVRVHLCVSHLFLSTSRWYISSDVDSTRTFLPFAHTLGLYTEQKNNKKFMRHITNAKNPATVSSRSLFVSTSPSRRLIAETIRRMHCRRVNYVCQDWQNIVFSYVYTLFYSTLSLQLALLHHRTVFFLFLYDSSSSFMNKCISSLGLLDIR